MKKGESRVCVKLLFLRQLCAKKATVAQRCATQMQQYSDIVPKSRQKTFQFHSKNAPQKMEIKNHPVPCLRKNRTNV